MGIPELNSAMSSKSHGIVQDIDMWHKRIGHVNIQRLKNMQVKGIIGGLPRFKYDGSLIIYTKHASLGNRQGCHFLRKET